MRVAANQLASSWGRIIFAHPESNSGGTEENYFWAAAGGYIKADGKTLMPMLDVEVFSGHVGATSYSDWANQFNNSLVADAKATGVKITPFIYTSSCSACNFNSSVAGWGADLANYNGESSQTGNPWNVCTSCEAWGSGVWDAWQYTDSASVSGVSGGVDGDVINGTVATWTATSRVVAASKLRVDFNNDGRDDYAFFRPSDGTWHVNFSSALGDHTFQWGQNGDIPLLGGDFSGDGAADAVVFRPSNATWYVRFSQDASSHSFSFGQSTDTPLLGGDFDDDGSPDAVLFRASTA
ncbi:MAG: GH25 family lysozyme, partial [Limisphaerales bacterium]